MYIYLYIYILLILSDGRKKALHETIVLTLRVSPLSPLSPILPPLETETCQKGTPPRGRGFFCSNYPTKTNTDTDVLDS